MTEGLLTEAEIDALFDGATASVFRLETLPSYAVEEETERIAAWRAGRPRPEQSVRTSPWLAEIAASTLAGVRWQRVRVVDVPLTEYQRYQLASLAEMQTAGCSVSVLHRPVPDGDVPDFWLFDACTDRATAVVFRYTPEGRFLGGYRGAADPLTLERDDLLARAVPLNEFLTSGTVTSGR